MSKQNVSYEEPKFSKLRSVFWPIHRMETKKFLPLSLMMCCVLFIYYLLRIGKDSMVVTGASAEVLNYVKLIGVLPCSILFFLVFTRISNKLTREKIFYILGFSFVAFFIVFALLIYPNKDVLHPSAETVQSLSDSVPPLRFLFSLFGVWTYAAFYIVAELWGSIFLSLLFWQFANQITRTSEASRFYPTLPLLGNLALLPCGFLEGFFTTLGKNSGKADAWGVTINYTMGAAVVVVLLMLGIYRWMNRNVLTDPVLYDEADSAAKKKKPKLKLSIWDSLKMIFTSRYLGLLAVLVLCYGVTINLIEIAWKSQVKLQFPATNDYAHFMSTYTWITGLSTILIILATKGVIRKYGWFIGAVITPLVIGVTGTLFFAFIILRGDLTWLTTVMSVTPILMAVIVGGITTVVSKGTKYSLFDPTKEMAYIPLDDEKKAKGKAAVDVVGGRFGKSGGSIIQMIALAVAGASASAISLAPLFAGIMIVMAIAWVVAGKSLSKLYVRAVKDADAATKRASAEAIQAESTIDSTDETDGLLVGAKA